MVDGAHERHAVGMELVLVDDHPAVRAGLRGLLDEEDDLRVAATAASAREGFEAIADLQPDVALLDHHLPDDDGLSLCLRTRALPNPPRAVIYSAFADAEMAVRAAIAGAEAVVPKATAAPALVAVLRAAGAGALRPALEPGALRAAGERLAADDLPILGMLAHGVAEDEIAATLGIEREWLRARRWAMLACSAPATMDSCPREIRSSRRSRSSSIPSSTAPSWSSEWSAPSTSPIRGSWTSRSR
jgi:DNA-binding NarL/FixJ family response regulator